MAGLVGQRMALSCIEAAPSPAHESPSELGPEARFHREAFKSAVLLRLSVDRSVVAMPTGHWPEQRGVQQRQYPDDALGVAKAPERDFGQCKIERRSRNAEP